MGLKYERQIRLDRGGWQNNCLESRILFLGVHYKELHQMNNWRAKKHATDTGVYFVSILKLSPTEWDWQYSEYDSEGGTFSAQGTIQKCPKPNALKCSYIASIPNLWNTFGHDTKQEPIGGKTIHETVMRVVEYYKQQEKVTL